MNTRLIIEALYDRMREQMNCSVYKDTWPQHREWARQIGIAAALTAQGAQASGAMKFWADRNHVVNPRDPRAPRVSTHYHTGSVVTEHVETLPLARIIRVRREVCTCGACNDWMVTFNTPEIEYGYLATNGKEAEKHYRVHQAVAQFLKATAHL